MAPLFVGDHPAMDFLNTLAGPRPMPIEHIADGRRLVRWMVEAGLLDRVQADDVRAGFGAAELDAVAHRARVEREWIRTWLQRWLRGPRARFGSELDHLNRLLALASFRHEVMPEDATRKLVGRWRMEIDRPDALLALIAGSVAALVTREDPARVRTCVGEGCTLVFLDRTKAGRRRYCSSALCGNRAKVAAFRARRRGAAGQAG